MNSMLILVVLLAAPGVSAPSELTIDELSRTDVRGTATSIAMIADTVGALPPAARAQASASLHTLSVSCPYTRSALMLPFALDEAVDRIDPGPLPPFAARDWAYLQQGLADHVAVLEALGVALPAPAAGDPLHGQIGLDAVRASGDPIHAASTLVDEITVIAAQIDEDTAADIALHSERVEQATGIQRPCPRGPWSVMPGQPWNLGMQLGGWHDALRRLEPFVEAPQAKASIRAMIALIDAHGEAQFASVAE